MSTLTVAADDREEATATSTGTWGFAHVPALDGLRGLAVLAVLLFHAGHLDGGYLGVDLFFVLSGYLITSLLLAEREAAGSIRLRAFWIRRARRLMPAVLLLLCGVAFYAVQYARPIDLDSIRGDALATLFYVANWHTIRQGTSYWDLFTAPSPLEHTWSLAIEEQFYLLWPFVVYAIARAWRSRAAQVIGWLALGLAVVSALLFVGLHHLGASDTRVYEGTDTRAAALLLGAAWAAWRTRVLTRVPRWVIEAIGVAAVVPLAVAWFTLPGTSAFLYRGGLPLCSLLAVLVVAAACEHSSPVLGRSFSLKPLCWLGLISYGLYLWHWPVYLVIDENRFGRGGLALLGARLSVTLVIALASFFLIERPIRRGHVVRGRPGAYMAVGGIVVTLALVLVSTRGAIDNPGAGSKAVGQAKATVVGKPKMLFVGDSVAMSVVRPVVADPERFGVNPINTIPGCFVYTKGHEYMNFAGGRRTPELCAPNPEQIVTETKPDVIFALVGARPNDFVRVDGAWRHACEPGFDRVYHDTMAEWLKGLRSSGAPVALGMITKPGANAIPIKDGTQRSACANRVLRRISEEVPGVTLIDTNELICPAGRCVEELEGDPIRTDGLHYDDGPGGARVSQWLVDQTLSRTGVR